MTVTAQADVSSLQVSSRLRQFSVIHLKCLSLDEPHDDVMGPKTGERCTKERFEYFNPN